MSPPNPEYRTNYGNNRSPEVRYWSRISFTPHGCWEWVGPLPSRGYPMFSVGNKKTFVHRWAFEQTWGEIPTGKVVMHICDNPACVRPAHLRVGTQAENLADMWKKGRGPKPKHRTHCKNGHELIPENLIRSLPRQRACRLCGNAAQLRFSARRRARVANA
jgi:hypothetical protein